jgi:hypothetical protein
MAYSWFILLLTIAGTAFLLLLLQGTSFGDVLHERIPDRPWRRLFVASVSFFLTFAGIRAVVYAIVHQIPPFHFIQSGGRHIHHQSLESSFSFSSATGGWLTAPALTIRRFF